jgi:hypothetical protein
MRKATPLMAAAAAVVLLVSGCRVGDDTERAAADGTAIDTTTHVQQDDLRQPQGDMRIEVNLARRELTVYRGGQAVETHPVAVGSSE